MPDLKWPQALAWHLRRQHLDKRLPRTKLLALTSELCGLHAQVMSSAELTALCRLEGLRPGDVSKALWTDRRMVKTWAMRSTLHLLPAEEYGKWLHVFSDYDGWHSPAWLDYFGVTAEERDRITEAVGQATRGRLVTRQELAEEVMRITGISHLGDKLRQGWGSMLKPACYRGYLCFGPNKWQNTQFTHPETRVDSSEADVFVARKYFGAYGPATFLEFARWLQVGKVRTRAIMKAAADELAEVRIKGETAWMLRKHVKAAQRTEPVETVRLLPAFDQYVFASGLRAHRLLPEGMRPRVYKNQGWFAPVLLVDGRMEGVWSFARKPNRLEVTIEPFRKASMRVRRASADEAERIAQYMERPLELKWRQ